MKLIAVWNAVATSQDRPVSPWNALAKLKMPPKVAYRILKYGKLLYDEFDVVEKRRTALIYEAAGVPEGEAVSIEPNTPEFQKFIQSFNEFLQGESDLKPLEIGMETLIDALDAEKGNVLSEEDIAALEPFFQEAKQS